MDTLEIGALFAGRYRIVAELGSGGMGAVYRAHHEFLDRDVAIKLLRSSLLTDLEAMGRFRREAKAASRIEHVNVTRVFDFGHTDAGLPYLAMELVEGVTLAEALEAEGPFSIARARSVLSQILAALGAAHAVEVVHRDLKPANVMLCGDDVVKVLDFGLAKILAPDVTQLTQEGTFGTPEYLSPEQINEAEVDHRCDLYSFGLLAFELLTGKEAFSGELMEVLYKQTDEPTPKASEVAERPELSPGFDALIARCTEKDPAARFQSTAEVAAALAAAGA